MTEKNSYEKTIDYAISKGIDYDSHNSSRKFYLSPSDPFLKTKFVVFEMNDLFFIAYDTYASKTSMTKTFTGIYRQFPFGKQTDVSVLKRDILDKVFRTKREKTGDLLVDKAFTIRTNGTFPLTKYFDALDSKKLLALSDLISPIELLIKSNYIEFVNDLKGHNVIGIETNEWVFEHDKIDFLMDKGAKLLADLIHKTSD